MDSWATTYLVHSKRHLDHDQNDNSHGDHDGDHDDLVDDYHGHGNGTTGHHFSAFHPWPWHWNFCHPELSNLLKTFDMYDVVLRQGNETFLFQENLVHTWLTIALAMCGGIIDNFWKLSINFFSDNFLKLSIIFGNYQSILDIINSFWKIIDN